METFVSSQMPNIVLPLVCISSTKETTTSLSALVLCLVQRMIEFFLRICTTREQVRMAFIG